MERYSEDAKIFGDNLRLLRKVRRLSQKDMAKIMDVSVYCVRKAEQGIFVHSLHTEALVNLSQYFRLRPSTFFTPSNGWRIDMLFHGENEL